MDWTYDSNAIEGSTLSRGDTFFLLEHGITVEGKPLKDFLDARNHAEAVDFLRDTVANERAISAGLMKEINALLLFGVRHMAAVDENVRKIEKPATLGEYKKLPSHVLQPDGAIHRYVDPNHVPAEMDGLAAWISKSIENRHPAVVAALAHFNMVRIHPFDDGNGRGARILMNLILMKKGFLPAIIEVSRRKQYIESLVNADAGNLNAFVMLVVDALISTQQSVLSALSETAE